MYVRAVSRGTWRRPTPDDAISELTRSGTSVSFYRCESQRDVELVAVALCARREFAGPFDYLWLEDRLLDPFPISLTPGATPLPDANRLHRDVDLSTGRARLLVFRIWSEGPNLCRIREPELRAIAGRLREEGQPIPQESWLLRER